MNKEQEQFNKVLELYKKEHPDFDYESEKMNYISSYQKGEIIVSDPYLNANFYYVKSLTEPLKEEKINLLKKALKIYPYHFAAEVSLLHEEDRISPSTIKEVYSKAKQYYLDKGIDIDTINIEEDASDEIKMTFNLKFILGKELYETNNYLEAYEVFQNMLSRDEYNLYNELFFLHTLDVFLDENAEFEEIMIDYKDLDEGYMMLYAMYNIKMHRFVEAKKYMKKVRETNVFLLGFFMGLYDGIEDLDNYLFEGSEEFNEKFARAYVINGILEYLYVHVSDEIDEFTKRTNTIEKFCVMSPKEMTIVAIISNFHLHTIDEIFEYISNDPRSKHLRITNKDILKRALNNMVKIQYLEKFNNGYYISLYSTLMIKKSELITQELLKAEINLSEKDKEILEGFEENFDENQDEEEQEDDDELINDTSSSGIIS